MGTRHAQFRHFPLQPKKLVTYLLSLLRPAAPASRSAGHNPASSWLTLLLLTLALGLPATGLLMSQGYAPKTLEETHEVLSTLFILGVAAHLMGLAWHTFSHRDPIGFSMLDGKKREVAEADLISSSRPLVGVLCLFLLVLLGHFLLSGFDEKRHLLRIGGQEFPLGPSERPSRAGGLRTAPEP